jgi:hypothetical protein
MISFLREFFATTIAAPLDPPAPLPPLILGLTGPAGSGKDSVASILEDQYGFVAIAFADPLRDMLLTLAEHVDVDGAWLVEPALKEHPLPVLGASYRELAQGLGTEWGRRLVREDFWISIAAHKLRQALAGGDNVALVDVRFPNEAAWLAEQGGTLVRVLRPGVRAVRPHESEHHTHHLHADHVLPNDSSLGALEHRIDVLLARLRERQGATPA